jgi:rhodanese-related sulfurtransferase
MKQLTPQALSEYLQNTTPVMIDVREAHELVHGMIEGAKHIPMNDIPLRIDELEPAKSETVVLICRSGKRSAQVGQYLEHLGFNDIINLDGGMNGWASEVDTSMTVY